MALYTPGGDEDHLREIQLIRDLRDAIQNRLTFEVTESAVMRDTGVALDTLQNLRALGVAISVDDFGTGHSSLAQLRQLPVQELKIDKSFVLNMDHEEKDQLIRAMEEEGVPTWAQNRLLQRLVPLHEAIVDVPAESAPTR